MPLNDNYESEHKLKELANQLAPALDTILDEEEVQRYGFTLFLYDYKEGLMQYVSSVNREDAIRVLRQWLARQDLDALKVEDVTPK